VRTVMQLYQWLKPPASVNEAKKMRLEAEKSAIAAAQQPTNPLPQATQPPKPIGGAAGRGNMVPGLTEGLKPGL
jgi:hypothetical protein